MVQGWKLQKESINLANMRKWTYDSGEAKLTRVGKGIVLERRESAQREHSRDVQHLLSICSCALITTLN